MRKIYLLFLLLFTTACLQAQNTKTNINIYGGWGTETNMGFYGGFGGLGIEKPLSKKLVAAGSVTYFSGHGDKLYTNSEDKYASLFVTPKVGYHVAGNQQSFCSLTLLAGPALKWYHYKWLATNYVHVNADGSQSLVEPVNYEEKSGANLSFYSGVDLSFTLSSTVKASTFLDTYSHDILLEHFMPGIKIGFQL